MPGRKAVGTKTAYSTRVVATMGPVTWAMARLAASLALSFSSSMRRWVFSTTTMASSTTMPMARMIANRETVLMDSPAASRTAKVPMIDPGMARTGTRVERQSPRKA